MSGFSNPIIGGGGSLVYPSIHSPNFDLSPFAGWSIMKNGNAYFANITAQGTITGSTFDGTNFVINQAGAFFYSGTPANGNLIQSITTNGGTDTEGNVYLAGTTTYANGTSPRLALQNNGLLSWYYWTGSAWAQEIAFGTSDDGTSSVMFGIGVGLPPASIFQVGAALVQILTSLTVTGELNVNGGKAGNIFAVGTGPSDFVGTVYLEDGTKPATPGTAAALYSTNGQLKYVAEDGNAYNTGCQTYFATGQNVISTSLEPVTGITGISVAAQTYRIHAILNCTKGATADTNKIGIAGPGTGGVNVDCVGWLENIAGFTGIISSIMPSTFGSTTTASVAPATHFAVELDGYITFTAAGTSFGLTVACGTANADTWTVDSGFLDLMPCF
jgi:hypothetical protein